jgi:hypothetical protein
MKRSTPTTAAPNDHSAAITTLDLDHDGVIEISTQEQAQALARHLLDPKRDKPTVVISVPRGASWRMDAESVYDTVTPLARVARIHNAPAAYALSAELPSRAAVYGNAGRVYPTGTGWASDPAPCTLRIARNPAQAATAVEDLASIALIDGYPATTSRRCGCDETKALNAQIRELQRANSELERLLHRRTTPPAEGRRPRQPTTTDPETRFRTEVTNQWQQRVAQLDHDRLPLPDRYPLTPTFLASLDRMTPSEYRKAASVAMEILTGLVHTLPGRQAHRVRTGSPGNNPHQRTSAGQLIWRANIQTHSPAARRIHWTSTPDGQVELLHVSHHDQPIAA